MFRQPLEFGDYNVLTSSGETRVESKQQNKAQMDLLSGWKNIATYLGKAVRTVQRYERELGLPVRRVSGNPTGAVTATKSDLDSWVRASATAQESFNRSTRSIQAYLSSEVSKGFQERADVLAEIKALRKAVKTGLYTLRESILKLRQQLSETQRRQDSMALAIRQYSRRMPVNVKHRKPN